MVPYLGFTGFVRVSSVIWLTSPWLLALFIRVIWVITVIRLKRVIRVVGLLELLGLLGF